MESGAWRPLVWAAERVFRKVMKIMGHMTDLTMITVKFRFIDTKIITKAH